MNDVVPKKTHLWEKGKSGNPKGRPPGSKNQISLLKVQVEGELRTRMKDRMADVVEKMMEAALSGDADMQKTLFKAWVSNTRAGEDETPKERIQIVIGKLEQTGKEVPIKGTTVPHKGTPINSDTNDREI